MARYAPLPSDYDVTFSGCGEMQRTPSGQGYTQIPPPKEAQAAWDAEIAATPESYSEPLHLLGRVV